jgi:hypothetical protein
MNYKTSKVITHLCLHDFLCYFLRFYSAWSKKIAVKNRLVCVRMSGCWNVDVEQMGRKKDFNKLCRFYKK